MSQQAGRQWILGLHLVQRSRRTRQGKGKGTHSPMHSPSERCTRACTYAASLVAGDPGMGFPPYLQREGCTEVVGGKGAQAEAEAPWRQQHIVCVCISTMGARTQEGSRRGRPPAQGRAQIVGVVKARAAGCEVQQRRHDSREVGVAA